MLTIERGLILNPFSLDIYALVIYYSSNISSYKHFLGILNQYQLPIHKRGKNQHNTPQPHGGVLVITPEASIDGRGIPRPERPSLGHSLAAMLKSSTLRPPTPTLPLNPRGGSLHRSQSHIRSGTSSRHNTPESLACSQPSLDCAPLLLLPHLRLPIPCYRVCHVPQLAAPNTGPAPMDSPPPAHAVSPAAAATTKQSPKDPEAAP